MSLYRLSEKQLPRGFWSRLCRFSVLSIDDPNKARGANKAEVNTDDDDGEDAGVDHGEWTTMFSL